MNSIQNMDNILQLYPLPAREIPLVGAYLEHDLQQQARNYADQRGKPFVYSNFVVSLDGRIAIPHPTRNWLTIPKAITNPRDWRLFQELAAQADILLSSGRYLREWAAGRAQEILQVDDPRFADLREWRQRQGLPPQPDIAIVSNSLNFPIPEVLTAGERKVVVVTSGKPDPQRVREIESRAGEVIVAGEHSVTGEKLVQHLGALGYRSIYSSAGPKIMHLLAEGGVLERLYLSYAHKLLGGQPFSSILEGPLLDPVVGMKINSLYLDPYALDGLGQLLVSYNRA